MKAMWIGFAVIGGVCFVISHITSRPNRRS
jgi:preprotein translocase subunit Sss1